MNLQLLENSQIKNNNTSTPIAYTNGTDYGSDEKVGTGARFAYRFRAND